MPKKGSHIYMMGICGTAMGGLAGLLKSLGYKVTGSDQNVYPPMSTQLKDIGIEIVEGYKKENLASKPDLVIVGNVMTQKNEEVQALLASGIPYTHLPNAIGEFIIEGRDSIVISGTHGKTTTTAMASFIAEGQGLKPGFLIGGKPIDFPVSFRIPQGNTFVIEGDEYDTAFFAKVPKFLFYKPRHAILTSVEFDHADIYKDFDAVKKAFDGLLDILPSHGTLVACADDDGVLQVLKHGTKARVVTYGMKRGDYQAKSIELSPQYASFDIYLKGEKIDHLQIQLFGSHNIKNALAVYALGNELEWNLEKLKHSFAQFRGVKRRQEIIGKPRDITVIEDFAHHPTAVKVTAQSIRDRFPGRRIYTVFEPRSATSRRKVFQKDYVEAFTGDWTCLFAKPFNQSNIQEDDRFSSEDLVNDLKKNKVNTELFSNVNEIVGYLKKHAQSGDVILIMSNGGFDGIYQKLLTSLA
ncbi:MAG: UDP-N-acetylmuramate:L-alanyl-gamma-D-glutamyl-meso-diaminopimelate ligase [Bdellovibrionales bacterium]